MIDDDCRADLADQRVEDLRNFFASKNPSTPDQPSDAIARERSLYGKFELRVDNAVRPLLARSESAWHAYVLSICADLENTCASEHAQTRMETLKDSWLAEPFW